MSGWGRLARPWTLRPRPAGFRACAISCLIAVPVCKRQSCRSAGGPKPVIRAPGARSPKRSFTEEIGSGLPAPDLCERFQSTKLRSHALSTVTKKVAPSSPAQASWTIFAGI